MLATLGEVEIIVGILLPVLPTAVLSISCVDELAVMVTEPDDAVEVEVDLEKNKEILRKLLCSRPVTYLNE